MKVYPLHFTPLKTPKKIDFSQKLLFHFQTNHLSITTPNYNLTTNSPQSYSKQPLKNHRKNSKPTQYLKKRIFNTQNTQLV